MAQKLETQKAYFYCKHFYVPHDNGNKDEYGIKLDVLNKAIRGGQKLIIIDVGIAIDHPGTIVFIVSAGQNSRPFQLACNNAVKGHWKLDGGIEPVEVKDCQKPAK